MSSLRDLALKYKTDKAGGRDGQNCHEYCEAYEMFLGKGKDAAFTFIEIGIGGYQFPDRGGESLRMWRDYFSQAEIHGVDLHPKNFIIPGVHIHQGSQVDAHFWEKLLSRIDTPGVIIDDASHVNPLTIKTFELLFPMLAKGGLYVVEDAHTSYWDGEYEGGWNTATVMNYFLYQSHALNYEHWQNSGVSWPHGYSPIPHIESITFFKEIIFIRKEL